MFRIITLYFSLILIGCVDINSQSNQIISKTVDGDEFSKLLTLDSTIIVDVRTPDEFKKGHLNNAINIDYNADDFSDKIGILNRDKNLLVYCFSGGRSADAMSEMKDLGFRKVYNLKGGIMKWKQENREIVNANITQNERAGMTVGEFMKLINSKEYVLIDFNAKWCIPCKKLMPIVEKIAAEKSDKLALVKIDSDENPAIIQAKLIGTVPYLELYNNGKLIWLHNGFIEEAKLRKEIGI